MVNHWVTSEPDLTEKAFRGDTEQIWGPDLSLFTQRPLWVLTVFDIALLRAIIRKFCHYYRIRVLHISTHLFKLRLY